MAKSSMSVLVNNEKIRTFGECDRYIKTLIFELFEKSVPEIMKMYPQIKIGDTVDIVYRIKRRHTKKYVLMNLIKGCNTSLIADYLYCKETKHE